MRERRQGPEKRKAFTQSMLNTRLGANRLRSAACFPLTLSTASLMRWSSFSSADICDAADGVRLGAAVAGVVMPGPETPAAARYAVQASLLGASEAFFLANSARSFS
jgi:hypothetical protein